MSFPRMIRIGHWSLATNKVVVAAVFVTFGVLGVIALAPSHAATGFTTSEPEKGTLMVPASIVSDTNASGSSAIKFGAGVTPPTPPAPPVSGITCNLNATTANFAAQVSAATAGQAICLASGSYGQWSGTNKAITITKQTGATPTMSVQFGSSASGFTLDDMAGMGGGITAGAKNITIRNSAFTSALDIDGVTNANILIDHNTSTNVSVGSTCQGVPAHFYVGDSGSAQTGVTVSNNTISGGDADGIRADSQLTILNNEIFNVYEAGANDCAHTDGIQFYGGEGVVIKGNYIHNASDGIVAYDGTANNDIENNVLQLVDGRYGIELYSDKNSKVIHNTLVYGTGCAFDPCGGIYLDHKSGDAAGSGTVIQNNIASTVNTNNGSTAASNTGNMIHSGGAGSNFTGIPVYSGGANPTTYAGFKLAAGSPGIGKASDGSNVGIN